MKSFLPMPDCLYQDAAISLFSGRVSMWPVQNSFKSIDLALRSKGSSPIAFTHTKWSSIKNDSTSTEIESSPSMTFLVKSLTNINYQAILLNLLLQESFWSVSATSESSLIKLSLKNKPLCVFSLTKEKKVLLMDWSELKESVASI